MTTGPSATPCDSAATKTVIYHAGQNSSQEQRAKMGSSTANDQPM
jgi:hypothetical protein